ncbi:MAG: DUF4139 domain-containing protein [Ignavibacteriae bacterium]|nr:MAG: DUF4139 domain-containing protein [Ignavibacteriota bacterium]
MKTTRATSFLLLCCLAAGSLAPAQTRSSASDRTSVDLTIYNQNLALVREERTMDLLKGMNRIIVPDIPATIDGTSLHFSSLTDPPAVKVIEQNYQYDLVHQAKLMEKYIGREVEFFRNNNETNKEYSVKGKLLATGWQPQPGYRPYGGNAPYYATGQMIAEIDGKIEIGPAGRLVLPGLPEGLILKPQLEWLVANSRQGLHRTEISYLAGQLTWSCSYVALLNANDSQIDLTGWVTIINNSGTTFKNAGLKLVAGDVNLVNNEQAGYGLRKSMNMAEASTAAPQFQQKELFEYKLYTLQRRTDIRNNETKQIELTSAKNILAKKIFMYDGLSDQWRYWANNYSYREQGSFGQQSGKKVGVYVAFKNDEQSGLGIALPKGSVRVYKRDSDGKEQFVGEDEIDHTPKDEELKLFLGNAFDIVGEHTQQNFRVIVPGHVVDETIEIKVRNHKSEPVEILVVEHPWRWNEWDITKSSAGWEKVDQTTVRFPLKLKKDEEKVVTYTIRYNW